MRATPPSLQVALAAALAALAACDGPGVDDDDTPPPNDDDDPSPGALSYVEEGQERGLDVVQEDPQTLEGFAGWGEGGRVIARDLDGDGDVDLAFGAHSGPPLLFANDGAGVFSEVDPGFAWPADLPAWKGLFSAELTGDGVPDLLLEARGTLYVARGLSELRYGAPTELHRLERPGKLEISNVSVGDADGDGALDLLLSVSGHELDANGDPRAEPGSDAVLLLQDAGAFTRTVTLRADGFGTAALVGTLTDFDGDGVLDVYVPQDLARPGRLWRGVWAVGGDPYEDVSAAAGIDAAAAAMGIDSADRNEDGRLDYCVSDIGPPMCFRSEPGGGFTIAGAAWGLVEEEVGWGIAFDDLDNDGILDLVQAGGPANEPDGTWRTGPQRNLLWRGQSGERFGEVGADVGFEEEGNYLGLATADLDGDGVLEIVVAGPGERPRLYRNVGATGSWVVVDVYGADGTAGFGAQIAVRAGGRTRLREVAAARGPSQRPPATHFGLGDAEQIEWIEVRWPGGETTRVEDVAARQTLRIDRE